MVRHFVLKTVTFQGLQTAGNPGIEAETFINENAPDTDHYGTTVSIVRQGAGTKERTLYLINNINPNDYNIDDLNDITSFRLYIMFGLNSTASHLIEIYGEDSEWEQEEATWHSRITGILWPIEGGLLTDQEAIDTDTFSTVTNTWAYFDLKRFKTEDQINILLAHDPTDTSFVQWKSCNTLDGANNKPYVQIIYKSYSVLAFDSQDAMLKIAPYEENPLYPKLTWGKIEPDSTFSAIKIYRKTSAFTAPIAGSATLVATLTDISQTEYVDTTTPTAGQQYWYMVIVEGTDTTGDDATFSNVVSFTCPQMTVKTLTPPGAQNVGTQAQINFTSTQLIKRAWVDWKDGSISWYDFDTASLTQVVYHIYTAAGGAWTPDVRIEDSNGYWSPVTFALNSITPGDLTPVAKLQINVREVYSGDNVSLIATLSQPKASNATITKYEFKRNAADAYQDNGTNPVYTFATTAYAAATYTATVRITTSTSLTDTDTATYAVVSATATALEFSNDTSINDIEHTLPIDGVNDIPLDSAGVEYFTEMTRGAEKIIVHGTSTFPNLQEDIDIIRAAWTGGTYISITTKEKDGTAVTYSGRIDGDISLGQSFQNVQGWSFPMIVFVRS